MSITRTFQWVAFATLAATSSARPESANHYLAAPEKYEGKTIKLDVRVVRPVPWTSPVEGVRFFFAFTEDKRHNALAGGILVAVPATESEKFVDEYSLRATANSETLRGVFRSAPTRKEDVRVYFVDYEGRCNDFLSKTEGMTLDPQTPARRIPRGR